jgi:hypothetical protein
MGNLQNQQSQQLTTYKKPIIDAILSKDRTEIYQHLANFKERGVVKFEKVLAIQKTERIPSLVQLPDGRTKVSAALSASIKSAFDNVNLRVGLTPDQMVEIAELIIDQSEEDNLALEDVLLFLQQLITGQAGKIYDRMDVPTFFELFETYRQKRHDELLRIREESHINLKAQGDKDRTNEPNPISEHMSRLGESLSRTKEQLREQREINRMNKFSKDL